MDAAQVPEVTVHLLSSSELSVNWTSAPGCVRRYRASFAGPGRSFRTNTTATGLYFSRLRPGSRYTAGVVTEGEGRDSAEVTGSGATSVLPNVQSVTVTGRSDTQVSLQWKRVSSGSAPQYSYRLEFSNGTKTDSSITDTGELVTAVVRQLSPGTRYSFTLYTVSEQGNTSSGFTFSTVTTMDCSSQTWTTKGTIEGEIKGQFNLASAVRGEEVKTSKIDKNKITFTDLSPGCSYTVFLYAQSGTQVLLQCSLNKTIDADPVSGVTVRPVKPRVLAASWPGARGCVKQYRVSVSGPDLQSFTKSTTGTALDIPDLQPGCNYTVGVTTEGEGRDSTEVTSTAATEAPAVSQVTARPRGPHVLAVSWPQAGGCVRGYVVYASGACSPERARTAVGTTAVEVGDLRPGCTYTVAVATVGQGRNTSPNVTSTATTPPQTPKNVTVKDITGDRARISWEPITEGNYTGFEVTYITSNGSSQMLNVSGTSVILEGLTPGVNYSTSVSSYVMVEGTKIHSSAVTSHFQTVPAAKAYNPAVIAGVVIGGLVVFALIVFLIRRRKTRRFRRGGDDLADQLLD
ncbi:receptor-type tyrosine-protein phosphatase H-like [Lepisosteus oculatus]|uniref:receptor-type tyrosine-protein phosphatase H-like n=1 Tax=Lepisosteus oculatus TaxID=7918 RepID=UPI0037191AFF